MDYNTLVERLLDGTITPPEKAELDRLMHSSPEIDREVRSLLEVEQLLRRKAAEEDMHSVAFRESVRSNLKTSLGFSTATATDAHATSATALPKAGLSGSMRLLLITLVVAGAGVGYFLFRDSGSGTAQTPVAHAPEQQAEAPQPVPLPASEAVPPAQPEQEAAHPAIAETPNAEGEANPATVDAEPQVSADDNTASRAVEGTVETSSDKNQRYNALIRQTLERLKEQEQTSRASAAVTAKQVALLYDKVGDATNARRYFETARRYARESSVRETEGEIAAEYALFEARNGNRTAAEPLAADALRILRAAQSTKLSAWETSLKQLTTR